MFGTEVLSMKTLLSAILSLCFVVSVFGLTQDVPNARPRGLGWQP